MDSRAAATRLCTGWYHPLDPAGPKLHKTVGVRVGPVQVGGGAPVVVQSMTMTDTADAAATARQCIELARGRLGDGARHRQRPRGRRGGSRDQAADARRRASTAPLIGDFHYNGHLLLTRFPDCADALDKYRINPGQRRHRHAARRAVRDDLRSRARHGTSRCASASTAARSTRSSSSRRCRRTPTASSGCTSEEIINECMVLSALQSTELALESRAAQGSDHHLVQDVAAARSDRRLSRSRRGRPTSRCTSG